MTSPARYTQYKLATQAILMAYELLAPDPRSVDDLKQHIVAMQKDESYGDREIFFESMAALDEGIKHKWFYRD